MILRCPTNIDMARGFDHGIFIPLKVGFPQADILCVQLSLRADLDLQAHIAVGCALAPLRDEGVLIIGSGSTYHNMGKMMRAMQGRGGDEINGVEFDRWLSDAITQSNPAIRCCAIGQRPLAHVTPTLAKNTLSRYASLLVPPFLTRV